MTFFSEAEHRKALDQGDDVPEQVPRCPLYIKEVGISNKTVWVQLPEGRLPFSLDLSVDLPARRRGIHMSRLEEIFSDLAREAFADLPIFAEQVCRRAAMCQNADAARVELTGKLPVNQETPVSKKSSHDTLTISAVVSLVRQDGLISIKRRLGMAVQHMTACPCTQAYSAAALAPPEQACPLPTHSQRSTTSLAVETGGKLPSHHVLHDCLCQSLHVNRDLLKRTDEAEFVFQVHRHPQFAEDVVRECAFAAAARLDGQLSDDSLITVESTSLESIHLHDVHCRLNASIRDIRLASGESGASRQC